MRVLMLGMLALVLTGCVVTDREALYYTRADIDAITSTIECKQLARNLVQVARCETRR
jgi:uncharacterized lipoprotein YmbA